MSATGGLGASGTGLAMLPGMRCNHLIAFLVVATLGAADGCVVRGRVLYTVDVAPPPPRVGLVIPRPGHIWIEGNWQYVHGHWVWRDGTWVRDRPGHVWVPGSWSQRGHQWHWQEGRWDRRDRPAPARPQVRDHRTAPPPSPVVVPPPRPPTGGPR